MHTFRIRMGAAVTFRIRMGGGGELSLSLAPAQQPAFISAPIA